MALPVIELIKKLFDFVLRERGSVLLAALSVLAFLGMASEVLEHEAIYGDAEILRFAHPNSTRLLDAIALVVTQGGSGNVLVPVDMAVFGYFSSQKRSIGAVFWAASAKLTSALNVLSKQVFERSRPDDWVSIFRADLQFPEQACDGLPGRCGRPNGTNLALYSATKNHRRPYFLSCFGRQGGLSLHCG